MGQATAVAIVLIAITVLLSVVQFIISKKWVIIDIDCELMKKNECRQQERIVNIRLTARYLRDI